MSFEHACFISYRHRRGKDYKKNILKLYELLEGEIELLIDYQYPVYFDEDRTTTGQFLNRELAEKLCKTVSLVVFWIPVYFSKNSLYCSREFHFMEEQEKIRQKLLNNINRAYIHIIALTSPSEMPKKLVKEDERLYADFEPFLKQKNWHNKPEVRQKIKNIADYIYARHKELNDLGDQPFKSCSEKLIEERKIQPWLDDMLGTTNNIPSPKSPSDYV